MKTLTKISYNLLINNEYAVFFLNAQIEAQLIVLHAHVKVSNLFPIPNLYRKKKCLSKYIKIKNVGHAFISVR